MNHFWDNLFKKDQNEREVYKLLSENYIFSELTRKELHFVESVIHTRNYRPQEPIFKQGELGIGMYIIMRGKVSIYVEPFQEITTSSSPVSQLETSDFFGEIALVEENGHRTATAIAATETTLIGFFKPDLVEIIDRNPSTGSKILNGIAKVLGRRLRATSEKVMQLKREIAHTDSSL